VTTIEEVGFLLFEVVRCLQNLFGDERFVHMHKHLDSNARPKFQNNKAIWHLEIFKFLKEHENMWEAIDALNAIVFPPIEVPPSSYGFIYNITSNVGQNKKSYQVIIGDCPYCNCMDFVTMMASLLARGREKWVQCKHIYYILQHVMYCKQLEEFMHCPNWNWNEVQCLISHVRQV
jgi:hypothetical protein